MLYAACRPHQWCSRAWLLSSQPTARPQLPAGRTDSVLEAGAPAPSPSELHNKKRLVSPPFVLVRALTALGVAPKNRVYMLDVGVLDLLLEVMAGDQPDLALGAAQVGLRVSCCVSPWGCIM